MKNRFFLLFVLVSVVMMVAASSCTSAKYGCPSADARGKFKG